MLEDLRTFFVQSMPLLFSVSFCMCFFSFVLGGCDFGQSFHKLYILAMCLHGNREAGWLGVPLFVAEVNWTIGLYGVCVVTEMPMDIITLDTWAP